MQSEVEGGARSTACLRGEQFNEAGVGGLPFQRVEKKSVVIGKKEKIKTPFA